VSAAARKTAIALALAATLTAFAPASAYRSTLTPADMKAAVAAGAGMAAKHAGYSAQEYIAFAVRDALVLEPGEGSIDAVVVGTPFERVRYAAYLSAFEGDAPASSETSAAADPDYLDFIVFAHSSAKDDQDFLRRFGPVTLRIGGLTLRPASMSTFGPAEDFFTVRGGARELRMLGYATFRFAVSGTAGSPRDIPRSTGKLVIVDPYGRRYDIEIDLAKYR
jgi:hypothetical protein